MPRPVESEAIDAPDSRKRRRTGNDLNVCGIERLEGADAIGGSLGTGDRVDVDGDLSVIIMGHAAPGSDDNVGVSERVAEVLFDFVETRTMVSRERRKCLDRVNEIADVRTFGDAVIVEHGSPTVVEAEESPAEVGDRECEHPCNPADRLVLLRHVVDPFRPPPVAQTQRTAKHRLRSYPKPTTDKSAEAGTSWRPAGCRLIGRPRRPARWPVARPTGA